MARKFVRLASPIKKMVKGVGFLTPTAPIPYGDLIPQAIPPTYKEGRFYYDDGVKTFVLYADIDGIGINVGEENQVSGTTGTPAATLINGQVIYQNGSQGQKPRFSLARADAQSTSSSTIGVMTHTPVAGNNQPAKATNLGVVRDMTQLSAFSDGDVVYLSTTVSGGLTNVKPDPTTGVFIVVIGTVLSNHPTAGMLLVNIHILPSASGITTSTSLWTRALAGVGSSVQAALDALDGVFQGYKEPSSTLTITAGAGSFDWGAKATSNIINIPTLTQNTVLTITGTLTTLKPVTLPTVPDTGGPWTLSYVANGKTKLLTRNGSGTADLETFELWSDGTDIFTADDGGLVWSKGV